MLYLTRLEMLARDQHSSLLGLLISYEENDVLRILSLALPIHIILAGKACQGQMLQFIIGICKLRLKKF